MRGYLWARVGAAVPLLALAGCGLRPDTVVCPAILASGVSVRVDTVAGTAYRVCVGAVCDALGSSDSTTGRAYLQVDLHQVTGARKVSVHFTATPKGSSKPTVDERTSVTLRAQRPNDNECGHGGYRAALAYQPAKGLVRITDEIAGVPGQRASSAGPGQRAGSEPGGYARRVNSTVTSGGPEAAPL